jgi:hypothetical protein
LSPALRALPALATFLSASLLFALQPMVGKLMLPQFGGAAAVWVTTTGFFQGVLLLGYVYGYVVIEHLSRRAAIVTHFGVLAASVPFLAWLLTRGPQFAPQLQEALPWGLLLALATMCLIPVFCLCATTPIVVATARGDNKHALFAASNAGSLFALLSMPLVLEPFAGVSHQLIGWSIAYVVFCVLMAAALLPGLGPSTGPASDLANTHQPVASAKSHQASALAIVGWAALGSAALAAVNGALTAIVPGATLLWVIPLGVYLLTFIVVFRRAGAYSLARAYPWVVVAIGLLIVPYLDTTGATRSIYLALVIFPAALYGVCFYCHGELATLQPRTAVGVGRYYVLLAFGGVLGTSVVALALPLVTNRNMDLLLLATVMAGTLIAVRPPALSKRVGVLPAALLLLTAVAFFNTDRMHKAGLIAASRNYYGVLRVADTQTQDGTTQRMMVLGSTIHGTQRLNGGHDDRPTSYFTATSGLGQAMQLMRAERPDTAAAIAVLGLGVGVVGSYCGPKDRCDFYEINPRVIDAAIRHFSFLEQADARGAKIHLFPGDARKQLAQLAPDTGYDIIVVDVYSDGMIPMHMITREAVALFKSNLRANGIIAVNVSSATLDLAPFLAKNAGSLGLRANVVVDRASADTASAPPNRGVDRTVEAPAYPSVWVLLYPEGHPAARLGVYLGEDHQAGIPVWTDDRHNVLSALPWLRSSKARDTFLSR